MPGGGGCPRGRRGGGGGLGQWAPQHTCLKMILGRADHSEDIHVGVIIVLKKIFFCASAEGKNKQNWRLDLGAHLQNLPLPSAPGALESLPSSEQISGRLDIALRACFCYTRAASPGAGPGGSLPHRAHRRYAGRQVVCNRTLANILQKYFLISRRHASARVTRKNIAKRIDFICLALAF